MGWGVINEEQRLIPQGSNNELKIEAGKPKKFRLLLQPGEEPYSFFEHTIENEKVENGQTTKVFRTVTCPKCAANPYAPCQLCDGQQIKRRVRHAANVWSYEDNAVKILKGGESIWKPIATLVKMGIDVTTLDFVVSRTGKDRNDTEYSVVNLGASAIPLPGGLQLFNIRTEYAPSTADQMKSQVEAAGLLWNAMIVPPAIQYPQSLGDALGHVIPNTKYKGQTMKQVWETNKGMIEFFSNSNRITPEKAAAQIILVALGGAQIPGVPNYANGGAVTSGAQNTGYTPTQNPPQQGGQQQGTPTQNPPQQDGTANPGRQAKVDEINKLLQTNQKFVKGGYQVIMDTMKQASNGKTSINEFADSELDKMIELCK